jgi:phosphoglycerol transferase MdoB-like AlkP superfamily enzyme
MRERLRLLLYFSIFWIGFQVMIRAIFLLYNHDLTVQLSTSETFLVFFHGFNMDLSMSGYFLMLTTLILTISALYPPRWIFVIFNSITILALVVTSLIVIVDLELYRHWGFRLDTTPIFYVMNAENEAMGSVDISVVIKLLLIAAGLISISLFVYSWWLMPKIRSLTISTKRTFFTFLVLTGLMFIPIRGSLKVAPMNTGFVYFHKTKMYANHSAINVVWNFLYSLSKKANTKYPEDFFDPAQAKELFKEFYPEDDSTQHVFTSDKPNVILIILESFTSDVIEPLGGVKGLTPNFNALCSEGILFDNFYSSGDRTDKGVVGVLSGYPAQPITNIIKYPAKTEKLPYLPKHLKALGYHTSFIHGGNIDFANFRSYFTNSDFDYMTTLEDFPDNDLESKWGIHDEFVFDYAMNALDSARTPFFNLILTLSSHEPFDVPMEPYLKLTNEESLFLNSVHYTDKCLGKFIDHAKKSAYWKNTVVILVADHGHRHPGNKQLQDRKRFRIPLLMAGGAVKKDSVVSKYGNHTDIANTLLAQLDKPSNDFKFSKNLFSPSSKSFSFYFFNNGFGYVAPGTYVVWDNTSKQFNRNDGASPAVLESTKAYQQVLYSDYNKK